MLPTLTLRQLNTAGQTQQGLVDDVSTRSLLTVRVGEGAGKISTGTANAFVGYEAGKTNLQGSYATFVGYQAGEQNTGASYGTFVGAFAGRQNQRGNENVFVGYRTGERNISGSDCVAVGAYAMRDNASGNYSVAVGYSAGERCLDGSFNTMIGAEAGQDNRSGSFNTMAGYRSGRSTFQGNYNTYFGAYAGYSNNRGDENCFIGYRSGEALEQGNLNIAIGAYSMAKATMGHSNISIGPYSAFFNKGSGNILVGWNAGSSNYTGGLNVIVGVEAGTSNQGSRNVLIGYKSATYWKGDCNVLIGSEVSQEGSGYNSVIIGYKSAGLLYRNGERNIFIGAGSDSIHSNVSDAISIGTYNVSTTSESLSIGKNIQSAGINSVSLGFSIETNAENSVLVGKDLIITSAIYFKDPLNLSLASVVLRDATEKFGIQQILYTNYVLGTNENPHQTAEFGFNTSNTFNTITQPQRNTLSPTTYDLASYMNYYSKIQGCNIFYTHPSCNLQLSIESLVSSNIISYKNYTLIPFEQSGLNIYSSDILDNNTSLWKEQFNASVLHSNINIDPFIINVLTFNQYQYTYPVHIVKKHKYPLLEFSQDFNIQSIPYSVLTDIPTTINGLSSIISTSTDGLSLSSQYKYIVDTYPKYGVLNKVLTENINEFTYTPLKQALFVSEDQFTILPSTYVYDIHSNLYGISSNLTQSIRLSYDFETVLTVNNIHIQNATPLNINSNIFIWVKNGSYNSILSSKIYVNGFDSRYLLQNKDTLYACNEAINTPLFEPYTTTCNITVDTNTASFIFDSNVAVNISSLGPLYIGNTYRFNQYDASNIGFNLRFSASSDGIHSFEGTEYTCNVIKHGSLGSNAYIQILITSNTPNPLYYYAVQQSNIGGLFNISAIPKGPLAISYQDFLLDRVSLLPIIPNVPEEPITPLQLSLNMLNGTQCNLLIPFTSESDVILWEDINDTIYSSISVLPKVNYLIGPSKGASNIFIEQYPSYGLLSWSGASNNLQNIRYQPIDLWEPNSDKATFLLQRSTNIRQVKRIIWNIENVTIPFATSNYWIDTPTSNILVRTSNIPRSSFIHTSNLPIYDTLQLNITHSNIDTSILYSTNTIIYKPIESYNQNFGISNITSNITIHSNLDIFPGINVNKTIHIYDTTSLFITSNSTSNLQTSCNIVIVQESDDNISFNSYSNIVITFKDSRVIYQTHSYNSNYDIFHTWQSYSNIYDNVYKELIYSTYGIYPFGISNLGAVYETPSGSTVKQFSFSNYDRQSFYNIYNNLQKLNRTTLTESNQTITTNYNNLDLNTYYTVQKDVGIVSQYHSSNIALGNIYIGSTKTRVNRTFEPFIYKYSVQNIQKDLTIVKYGSDELIPIVIPPFKNRVESSWILLNTKYQGTLQTWDSYIRNQITLGFIPDTLYIVSISKGYITNQQSIIHRIPLTDISNNIAVYQASGRYDTDILIFFYGRESTGQCSTVYTNSIFLKYTPQDYTYTISSGLSSWNPISSNVIYTTAPESTATSLRIQFLGLDQLTTPIQLYQYPSKTLTTNLISWNQLTSNNIYFKTKETYNTLSLVDSIDLNYNIISTNDSILEQGTFRINIIDFTDYPQPKYLNYGALEIVDFLENSHKLSLVGLLNTTLINYVDKGGNLNPESIKFTLTKPSIYGFLMHSLQRNTILYEFSYQDVLNNQIIYIPYNIDIIPDDTISFKWIYQNHISPEYTISIKNYLIRSGPINYVPYRTNEDYRKVDWKSYAIVSSNTLTSIDANKLTISPVIVSYPYHSNILTSSNVSIEFESEYTKLYGTITLTPVPYSKPIKLLTNSITLEVNQSDRVSLKSLLDTNVLSYSIDQMYNLYTYIDSSPIYGTIITEDFNGGSNLSKWSYKDIYENRVYYQHFGNISSTNDVLKIRFSSHSYDITDDSLTIYINIIPLPKVLSNRYDAIYELNSNTALSTIYSLDKSITFNNSNTILHVLSTSNMQLISNGSNSSALLVKNITNTSYGYSLTSNYFQKPLVDGLFYEDVTMNFTISGSSNIGTPHSLASVPIYKPYFSYNWVSQLNRFESSNEIILPLLTNNSLQTIEYIFDISDTTSRFEDVETTFAIDIQPYNELYGNNVFTTSKAKQLSRNLQTYDFEFQFINKQNLLIASFHFTESLLEIYIPTIPEPYYIPITNPFIFNEYGLLQIVFNDTARQGTTSIYINPDETKSNKDNQGKNILVQSVLNIDITDLYKILLVSYANDSNNYYSYKSQKVNYNEYQLSSYQKLIHLSNRIYIRNFEIFTKNINTEITNIEAETYNVVLGKAIQVKGKKNICMGTNFTTLGRNSIILGNDIGYSENSISQIYESIIIGNTSFQGSTIRGIIAIGNELMNGLIGLDESSSDAINKFIANRPVIIGNSIGPEKVDYHINIANTLMRTKIGGLRDQIYLGNEQEFVAIGYTCNVHLQGPEILFVNGGIRANRVLTDILECTGGTLNIDAVSSSNLISSNVFANLVVTDVLQCRGGTLNIDAVETSNLRASYILTDVLECAGGILTIDAVDSSNMTTSNLYAQKIITDQLEYRSGVVNLQLINSSNIYASNIIVDKITTNAIEYPKGDIEFSGVISSNVLTDNFTTSNMIVNNSFYINPNAVGNVVYEGLRATLYERINKVFLITEETTFLTWIAEGVHYVDESDVEVFVNGIKLTYFNNNKYHYKISDIHYLNDFSQTKFDIQLTDPVYLNDVVDIHVSPKLVGMSGNVYDYFAITSNVLNLKTVNELYSPNATFSNIRILGSSIVGNYDKKHPYQVESLHKVILNQQTTKTISIIQSGYFEASPNDIHMYINGTKLAYLDSSNHDYTLTSNFSFQDQQTTFTLTLDSDIIAGDVVDVTLFPKAPRDQFGYFYQNFELKTSWEDDKISLTTLSNVGIGTHQPKSLFHVYGTSRFDGLLEAPFIQGQLYGPWNLQSNISSSLLTIHQQHPQCNIAQFLANSKDILTITQSGIGIGTTLNQTTLHVGSNNSLLIGQHPLLTAYLSPLTVASSNAIITNWAIGTNNSSIYEWKIGSDAIPSVYWTAEVTPQSEFIIVNKNSNILRPFSITNEGIITSSNISIIQSIYTSNIQTNYVTSSNVSITPRTDSIIPSIMINKSSENTTPILYASSGPDIFVINSKGWVGIGTTQPSVPIDINSTNAIQLPKGSISSRPTTSSGLIRFNTQTNEFEGCYGINGWGTLGGTKSFDGKTRIETTNDMSFYTNNIQYLTLSSNGNLGIGTNIPNSILHVEGNTNISGDLVVNGSIVFSNINVLSDDVFINQDRPSIRNRLQVQPLLHKFIVPTNQYNTHIELIDGLWSINPTCIDIYVNGTKWIYIDELNKDFSITYAHINNSNTQVSISLATPLNYGDVVDLSIWPKYITDTSILQPGYVLQNIYTYWNLDNSCNIYYTAGNIGIGTQLTKASLDVNGLIKAPVIEILDTYTSNILTSNIVVSNSFIIGTHTIEKDTFTVQRNNISQKPFVKIEQGGQAIFYLDKNGNIGIGTTLPKQKLHLHGNGAIGLFEDTLPSIQLKNPILNTSWKLELNNTQNRFDIIDTNTSRITIIGNGNIGIGTTIPSNLLHIQGTCTVTNSIRTGILNTLNIITENVSIASNATIGTIQVNNQVNEHALKVTQLNNVYPIASFASTSISSALIISNNGNIGIGTSLPQTSLHVSSKDSIILPSGSTQERPNINTIGQIRYNTTLQQFEGLGSNFIWGSLGGIRSSDRKTYISAEAYTGANDCNLRFYTNDILQTTINAVGNVGIGTQIATHKLRVEGDAYFTGTIIAPYMNITNAIFYNQDTPALRNRLQPTPTQIISIIQDYYVNQFNVTIGGVWMINPQKIQIYINGTKLIYVDEANKDYSVSFSHVNENTNVIITLDTYLNIGDAFDLSIWPSHYNENALNQSGIVVQNFNYSIWSSNIANANITYVSGNVGIGTTLATNKLTVNGNALIRGELLLTRSKYHTGGIFGTEVSPINGGTITYDLNLYDNAIIELSSVTNTLSIQFANISQNIGKSITIIFNERSFSNRNFIIDSLVKFASTRPYYITSRAVDKLIITVIKSTLLLGEYSTNVAAF